MSEYVALPFDYRRGDPERITRLLDYLCAHPAWYSIPTDLPTLRATYARLLLDGEDRRSWEVMRDTQFVGILHLSRIASGIDAVFHFVFLDGLMGKRFLLERFFDQCFDPAGEYRFRRLTMEVPETTRSEYLSFLRAKLGFRYEGESVDPPKLIMDLPGFANIRTTIARIGSRREGVYWSEKQQTWKDVYRLRLLAGEHAERVVGKGG